MTELLWSICNCEGWKVKLLGVKKEERGQNTIQTTQQAIGDSWPFIGELMLGIMMSEKLWRVKEFGQAAAPQEGSCRRSTIRSNRPKAGAIVLNQKDCNIEKRKGEKKTTLNSNQREKKGNRKKKQREQQI